MNTKPYSGTVIGGIVLIALGLIFLVATFGAFNLDWGSIWPLFPVLVGAVMLVQAFLTDNTIGRAGLVAGGTIAVLVGAFLFATTAGILSWLDQGKLWPVYPLIVSISFFAAYFVSNRELPAYLITGAILAVLGLVFLGINLTSTSYDLIAKIWPIFLILAGILLLLPRMRHVQG